jgi:hypothetical protein
MTQIDLEWDGSKGLFAIFAILSRKIPDFNSSTGYKPIYTKVKFYLDTITDEVAKELQIDINTLPKRQFFGIGGIIENPVTNDIEIAVLDESSQPRAFKLDIVQIMSASVKKKIEKTKGNFKERGEVSGNMVCLFGLDSIKKLGGELRINMEERKGTIFL